MPNKFLPPTTTTVTRTAATPIDGEVLYDTDEKKLYYGDGTTQGGKAIGSSTVSDSDFRIQDNSDATKQIAFEASGITTGTICTLTAPNRSGRIALIEKEINIVSVNSTVTLTLTSAYQQFLTPTVASVDVVCPSLSSGDYFEVEITNKHATNELVIKDSASATLGTLSSTSTDKDRWCRIFWDGTDLHYLPLGGY